MSMILSEKEKGSLVFGFIGLVAFIASYVARPEAALKALHPFTYLALATTTVDTTIDFLTQSPRYTLVGVLLIGVLTIAVYTVATENITEQIEVTSNG